MFFKVRAQLEVWLRGKDSPAPEITETVVNSGITVNKFMFADGGVLYWGTGW